MGGRCFSGRESLPIWATTSANDYCYKYVSNRAVGRRPSTTAKAPSMMAFSTWRSFNADGTGEWLELSLNVTRFSLRQLLPAWTSCSINTRLAADLVGATPMDRPEWTTIGKDGERLLDPHQQQPADHGRTRPTRKLRTTTATSFERTTRMSYARYLLRPGRSTFSLRATRGTEGVFTDPDAAWADDQGRLFIGTDGGQPDGLQDQLVVFDLTKSGDPEAKRLFVGVASDEITGFTVTPNYRTAFTNMQHPGNGDPSATNFPEEPDGVTIPRDCTIVIRRKNGGRIGS